MTTTPDELALAAGAAAAAVLPSAEPLTAGGVQPGTEQVAAMFAGAALAELAGPMSGTVGILVGEELVTALAQSPIGALDLPAAVQPALDAVARALGAGAQAAREASLEMVVTNLGGPFTVVPLIGSTIAAAVLVQDATLAGLDGHTAAVVPTMIEDASEPALMAGGPASVVTPISVSAGPVRGIEMLHGVDMEVTVELGRTRMTVRDLLALSPGNVLELDRAAGSPADLLVNGRLIARGEVVVVDEDFGLRVTEIVVESAAS